MFPHSEAELLKVKIRKENLSLIPKEDRDSVYDLEKIFAWQENYSFVEWEEFKHWFYCDSCECYSKIQCTCCV
jgi:hypothetical protein